MTTMRELGPPLPELARSARITYLDGTGRRAREVDEAVAVAARLEVLDVNGRSSRREVSLDEARAYLASVADLQDRIVAARERRVDEAEAEAARLPVRARVQEAMTSVCPHDGDRRRHAGRVMFLASPSPTGVDVSATAPSSWSAGAEAFEEYRCPTCGSVELFRPRPLSHPAGPET